MKKLFPILFISLFIFSCDENDNPMSNTNEIDVDWFLIRNPNTTNFFDDGSVGIGYIFHYRHSILDFSNNSGIEDFIGINDDGLCISFIYNGEEFCLDISDVDYMNGNDYTNGYLINSSSIVERIIYNQEMNYFTTFDNFIWSGGSSFSSSTPNELIDYR